MNNLRSTTTNTQVSIFDLILFFLGGLYIPKYIFIFIPFWLLSKLVLNVKISLRVKKEFLIVFTIYFFIFITLFIGKENIYLSNPNVVLPLYICIFLLYGYVISLYEEKERIICLSAFVLGMLLNIFYVVLFNYLYINSQTAYGNLFNPITDNYVNSPGWSLMLVLAGSYFILLLNYVESKIIKCLIFGQFFISVFLGVYLGGRAFFVIYALSLALLLLNTITSLNRLIFYLIVLSIVVLSGIHILFNYYPEVVEMIKLRFDKGLDSPRFLLWVDGFNKMLAYPFGGFEVNTSIDDVKYFHNFWLDTARVSGWLPTAASFLLTLYLLIKGLLSHSRFKYFYLSVSLVCLAIMFQDVIVEGIWRVLLIFYLINILMFSRSVTRENRRFNNEKN